MDPYPFHNFMPLYPMNSGRLFQHISFLVYLSVLLKGHISGHTHPPLTDSSCGAVLRGASLSTPRLGVCLFPTLSAKFQ